MKTFYVLALLLCCGTSAFSQNTDTSFLQRERVLVRSDSSTVVTAHGRYMFNNFWDNWYISAGAGGQVYFGDEDGKKSIGSRITPTFELAVGKWIHPAVGFRAQAGGFRVKGYSTNTIPQIGRSFVTGQPDADGLYLQQWNQVHVEGELLIDLSNAIGGYKRERFYSAIIFLGAGVALALDQLKNDPDRTAMVSQGIINRFRLGKYFDANIEIKNSIVNQNYDREQTHAYYEGFVGVMAGITYRFGEPGNRLFRKAADTRTVINRSYHYAPEPPPPPAPAPPTPAPTPRDVMVMDTILSSTPVAVFFELDKSVVLDRDRINISFIAKVIKESNGKRFRIVGSADSRTGTPPYNQQLSMRRCLAVKDFLVKQYGINPDQLVAEPLGGINKYTPYFVNRAVIIIQEGVNGFE